MRDLTREAGERILARNHLGRLACFSPSRDASYIVPISYVFHDGSIYLGTLPGQKLDYLREHPHNVCLEVDEITNDQTWLSVVVTGDFVELHGEEREGQEYQAIERALHGPLRAQLYGDGVMSDYQRAEQRLKLGAIRIASLSARQDQWSWDVDFARSLASREGAAASPTA